MSNIAKLAGRNLACVSVEASQQNGLHCPMFGADSVFPCVDALATAAMPLLSCVPRRPTRAYTVECGICINAKPASRKVVCASVEASQQNVMNCPMAGAVSA